MKQRIEIIIFLAFICTSLCGDASQENNLQVNCDVTSSYGTQNQLARNINEFGYKLMSSLMVQKGEKNVVLSPSTVAGLLAMLSMGSVGKTRDELARAIGFSQDILAFRNEQWNFGELLRGLNAAELTSKTLYANAIFLDTKAQLRKSYKNNLRNYYGGEAINTVFEHSDEAKNAINGWVKSHTEGRIEALLQDPLPTTTTTVLLSALYFSGQWKRPFYPQYTVKMPFTAPAGKVMADLMYIGGDFDYIYSSEYNLQMLSIPYNDSVTSMYFLKPRLLHKSNITELMSRIDSNIIDSLMSQMKKRKVFIRIPKMEVAMKANLRSPLADLGIRTMFLPTQANFGVMINVNDTVNNLTFNADTLKCNSEELQAVLDNISNPGVHVDQVLHEVKIKVDEYGTEAVAAAAAVLTRSAEQFYADNPFYMFIRNERTKLVTFSAVIFDPTS